jgi:hypothetical protein
MRRGAAAGSARRLRIDRGAALHNHAEFFARNSAEAPYGLASACSVDQEGTKMRRWLLALSRWAVVVAGLALTVWGPMAMWKGWETIQIERGWSLFIAGAVAVSGGLVTLALGAVLSRLDHSISLAERQSAAAAVREGAAARENLVSRLRPAPEEAPVEVDRYVNDGAVYVMFSDGSVELRGAGGARRFASVAELKAQVGF